MDRNVVVYRDLQAGYPDKSDFFRPSENYPEYPWRNHVSDKKNDSYSMVRECLRMYGLDKEHYGTAEWNPLKEYIKPGDSVVVKPNMVMDHNPSGEGTDCMYTHPSVVAAVVDYVVIALKGKGNIVIGDAPVQMCDFDKLVNESGYSSLIEFYKSVLERTNICIGLKDFRGYKSVMKNGIPHGEETDNGESGILIDLADDSEFGEYSQEKLKRLRITSYNPAILNQHHNENHHEYLINRDVIEADVIINMPKPKTHRKAGVTISLKNLVGINTRKEFLPHHCNGDVKHGGDEYKNASVFKKMKSSMHDKINMASDHKQYKKAGILVLFRKCLSAFIRLNKDQSWEGSWYGNETISKTITDLNKILLYADKNGNMQNEKQRKMFIVADMIEAGEKEGPLEPSSKKAGVIVVGDSPVCFDEAVATLMGMDIHKIPTIRQVRNSASKHKIMQSDDRARIISNYLEWNEKYVEDINKDETMNFVPTEGWRGHIELERSF